MSRQTPVNEESRVRTVVEGVFVQVRETFGRIMKEVCRLFGIEKLRTTLYKPSTNHVERFHRTMNSVLAKTVSESQKDWDLRLPFVMSAYRASRHESTGYTPNFLVFGRENRAPPDIIFGSPKEEPDDSYDAVSYTHLTLPTNREV